MNPVIVRNVKIGEGVPKICVPIVGVTKEEIINEAKTFENIPVDVVEWRVDWFEHVFEFEKVEEVLKELREALGETPLLFTFRTSKEGGEKAIEAKEYAELNKKAAATGYVDLVDVEAFTGDEVVKEIIEAAHEVNVKVVASNHDFDRNPLSNFRGMCYTESNSGAQSAVHWQGSFERKIPYDAVLAADPADRGWKDRRDHVTGSISVNGNARKVEGWVIMKKILFVASEAVPFIKTGGLADVVGSLPKCFDKEYFDVRVMIPKYLCIKDKFLSNLTYVNHFYMDYLGQSRYVGILEYVYEGITFYFIDNESYFWGDKPYGDWYYDLEKFSFFSQAALSALPVIGWRPDVIHCHDWQTGLIPVYLKGRFGEGEFFRGIKSVMTIHNLKFQGVWDVKTIQRFSGLPDYFFTPDKLEAYKDGNMLKGGLVYADAITTVSNTYAEEIKTPFYGEGLDGLMRARANDLRGIVNGIDYDVFDPETDRDIVQNYNAKNFRKEKVKNKRALQEELGLARDDKKFMIGIVSRLTSQKGLDLIQCVMDEICTDDVQLVVLGTGDENYENMFRHYDWKYHDRVSAQIYYSEPLSHKIYAACDAFLMPSLFEPCGLSQLMALRYGTVPIVRETGGLKDTVWPYNEFEGTGTGFSFANYNAHEMLNIIRYAKHIFYDKKREWNKIVDRAMAVDFSWNSSAKKYQELYDWLIGY